MHCPACVALTENELESLPNITKAEANLASCTIEVQGSFENKSPKDIALSLNKTLEPHGYSLHTELNKQVTSWADFKTAFPLALLAITIFVLLQKLGVVNLVTINEVNYGAAFIIGLVASVSTCMAVVGGLVLSMSANMAKTGDTKKPQLLFHIGRLLSFSY